MEELIKRLERVIATGAPDKDGLHPISAETVLEVVKQLSEHGTNLAEVGTDCISRQQAIDALYSVDEYNSRSVKAIKQLPPIQPGKDKVSDLLYHIYSIQSPHLDVTGVVAKKYYCEELWKELFGKESELPGWMN